MKKDSIILLAEDNEGHANLLITKLQRAGIENRIVHFINGEEILNYLLENIRKEGPSYIILLDIRMPKVDGIEVLRQVKQDDEMRKFPVIMVTTTSDPGTIQKCYDMGCINYVVKPIGHREFTERINQLAQYIVTMDIPP